MDSIALIRQKARQKVMTIALPEYNDQRVSAAAKIIEKEGIARVIVLDKEKVDPKEKERYIEEYYKLRQAKKVDLETVRELFEDPLWYAAMLTREGKVDGYVAGAAHTTADVARSAIHCVGMAEQYSIISSCFIMVVPDCIYGEGGTFIYADCGIIPEPSARQLACISALAAQLGHKVLDITPRIAMLSYSTRGSAQGRGIDKVKEALKLARELSPGILIDGELQVDAALVPEVAKIKYPDSVVGGKANILIFPDLEAGNISYKLTERLAKARALGPLIIGVNRPCSDLSRGCSVDDVVDCVAVTAIRAQ